MPDPLPDLRAADLGGRGVLHQIVKRHATCAAQPCLDIADSDVEVLWPLNTIEEGARAILNLATSPAVERHTGLYFNGLHEAKAQALGERERL
jgi:hypothetical protein